MNIPGPVWRWLRRAFVIAVVVGIGSLMMHRVRELEWGRVVDSLSGYEPLQIAGVAGLTLVSHLIHSGFDSLARFHVRHHLGRLRTLAVASVAYAFTLNLGALVGGVGFRYRLYARHGLDGSTVARIYAFVVVTNWSGYVLLLGSVLALALIDVPESWTLGVFASQAVGILLLLVVAGYLALCAFSRRRSWTIRDTTLHLPPLRLAGVQLAMSSVNWMVMSGLLYILLHGTADYATVLGTLLLASIAGAIVHVPAALGVLESVFLVMLSGRIPDYEIIAALIAYRAVYYLIPLLVALVNYGRLELGASASGGEGEAATRGA